MDVPLQSPIKVIQRPCWAVIAAAQLSTQTQATTIGAIAEHAGISQGLMCVDLHRPCIPVFLLCKIVPDPSDENHEIPSLSRTGRRLIYMRGHMYFHSRITHSMHERIFPKRRLDVCTHTQTHLRSESAVTAVADAHLGYGLGS